MIADPEGFWREEARRIDWMRPFTRVKDTSFAEDDLHIRWFADGTLNLAANCLDRHLAARGDQLAILWEPDDPEAPDALAGRISDCASDIVLTADEGLRGGLIC